MTDPIDRLAFELARLGWRSFTFDALELPGDGYEGVRAVVWLHCTGRGARLWRWTGQRYNVKPVSIRGGSPRTAAQAIHEEGLR